jgi:outer membrane protein OmpA-like peptidoglycan-associated protein
MKAHPEIAMVEIEGHTDSRGADAYNMSLSERRAASVKKYFESKGIESSRLSSKGYGETQPIASNTTNEGQLDNRRIVFRVTEFKDR